MRRRGERLQNFACPIAFAIASATSVYHSRPIGSASEIRIEAALVAPRAYFINIHWAPQLIFLQSGWKIVLRETILAQFEMRPDCGSQLIKAYPLWLNCPAALVKRYRGVAAGCVNLGSPGKNNSRLILHHARVDIGIKKEGNTCVASRGPRPVERVGMDRIL